MLRWPIKALPCTTRRPPIIVMAHGLGAQRDMGLQRYAEVFVAVGYAVVTFDYRHYGGSDGEPRQLASPKKQVQDWATAVDFIRVSRRQRVWPACMATRTPGCSWRWAAAACDRHLLLLTRCRLQSCAMQRHCCGPAACLRGVGDERCVISTVCACSMPTAAV
jgi:pimeloyl-ACP methyl ester carboxylesterase